MSTLWIIFGISIALIIIFAIMIAVYFLVFNVPNMHEIMVKNTTTVPINVIFGATIPNNISYLPVRQIAPGSFFTYHATPSVSILVQGYRNNDTLSNPNLFTTVGLELSGSNYNGATQITDGSTTINGLSTNNLTSDIYGVSVQLGYNLPITIESTTCTGPIWNHPITSSLCPNVLQ